MALGKIKADTLEHSTSGSVDTKYVVEGSAKAWVSMDAGETINDSLNTASLTDNATGDHTANWTNALSLANYAVATFSRATTTYMQIATPEGPFTTTTVTINTHQSNSLTKGDKTENGIMVQGELA
tara:strand:+ start:3221 stop:3598 length:378 start_codon:yes stop_codon:yes gene_type:complete